MHYRGAQEELRYAQAAHDGAGSDVDGRVTRVWLAGAGHEPEPGRDQTGGNRASSDASNTGQPATAGSHHIEVSQEAQEASQEARGVERHAEEFHHKAAVTAFGRGWVLGACTHPLVSSSRQVRGAHMTSRGGSSDGSSRLPHNSTRRSRNALEMTDTELSVIAALAQTGLINVPRNGYRMP